MPRWVTTRQRVNIYSKLHPSLSYNANTVLLEQTVPHEGRVENCCANCCQFFHWPGRNIVFGAPLTIGHACMGNAIKHPIRVFCTSTCTYAQSVAMTVQLHCQHYKLDMRCMIVILKNTTYQGLLLTFGQATQTGL